jgi:hypothetical protein
LISHERRKETDMDRRYLLKSIFGAAAAVATGTIFASNEAAAAVMPVSSPKPATDESKRVETDFRPDVDNTPTVENVQFGGRRRARRQQRRAIRRERRMIRRERRMMRRGF